MFATDIPEKEKNEILDKLATKIVQLNLETISIIFLESIKPLSFVGNQLLVLFRPFWGAFFPIGSYDKYKALLEERENVEILIRKIEEKIGDKSKKGRKKEVDQNGKQR